MINLVLIFLLVKLSILIPTLPERARSLNKLLNHLHYQARKYELEVEIITLCDPGLAPIGAKRNKLLLASSGDYVVFVDDDDEVSNRYLTLILIALQSGRDVIALSGLFRRGGDAPIPWSCSLGATWGEAHGTHYQGLTHLCPVKRELALLAGFPEDVLNGEDREYGRRLDALCKSQSRILEPLYFYNYDPYKPKTRIQDAHTQEVAR